MVLKITQSALKHLKKFKSSEAILQIYVSSGGCSGIKWDLKTISVNDIKKHDENINDLLIVEKSSIFHLLGSTLDYKESLKANEFIISNPNANHSCGCGKSFNLS